MIGILGADTKTSRREISTLEVESLEIVANDAARAIDLSGLYGRLVSERNFVRSIVTHMTSGIITLDEAGRVTWFNPYSEAILGIRQEEALGKAFREALRDLSTISDLIDTHWSLPAGEVMSSPSSSSGSTPATPCCHNPRSASRSGTRERGLPTRISPLSSIPFSVATLPDVAWDLPLFTPLSRSTGAAFPWPVA